MFYQSSCSKSQLWTKAGKEYSLKMTKKMCNLCRPKCGMKRNLQHKSLPMSKKNTLSTLIKTLQLQNYCHTCITNDFLFQGIIEWKRWESLEHWNIINGIGISILHKLFTKKIYCWQFFFTLWIFQTIVLATWFYSSILKISSQIVQSLSI